MDGDERSVPAQGSAAAPIGGGSGGEVRVYIDPINPDDVTTGWYRMWGGPLVLVVLGVVALVAAGRIGGQLLLRMPEAELNPVVEEP